MSDRLVPEVAKVYLTFPDPIGEVDVTDFVIRGGINRGRSRELDEFNAGTCTVTLENDTRDFDPPFVTTEDFLLTDDDDILTTDAGDELTTGSTVSSSGGVYGPISRGQAVRVEFDGVTVFKGWVDDWNHDWQTGTIPTATFIASDALGRLGRRKFTEWTTTAGQRVGARLTAVLARDEVDWSDSTDFDTGAFNLQSDLVTHDSNVLNYCQLLARTDGGRFFASRINELTYRGANLASPGSVAVMFRDDETDVDFYGVEVRYGSEQWYTEVRVDRVNGIRQTATADISIREQHGGGTIPLALSSLLMNTDAASGNLAAYLLDRYQGDDAVIEGLRIDMMAIADADAQDVAELDVGSLVTVSWTPTAEGAAVLQSLAVEGLSDDWDRRRYERYLRLSNADGTQAFILDDVADGVLDVSTLGL